MLYKDFEGLKLSSLGLGCMRLPVLEGNNALIDETAACEMVDYAMAHGVNYYDTAWGYHEGTSETVIGKALKKYPRESYYLASKFPGYDIANMSRIEEIFEEQLIRCGVKHFDFYLCHNVCEKDIDAYLDEENNGLMTYLMKQRENGRIRRLGFSSHASVPVLKRFLDAYGDEMEFCQIQLNYLDWTLQEAEAKVKLLNEYNIPIWVMEPLRGGRLVNLPPESEAKLKALRPDATAADWAFRFLETIPGIAVVLSGMSDMAQLKANIETFSTENPLTDPERNTLLQVAQDLLHSISVPCTGCRYCTSHCPQGLDIPKLISLYGDLVFSNGGVVAPMVVSSLPEDKRPSSCLSCGSCSAVCPQQIDIPGIMSDFTKRLG